MRHAPRKPLDWGLLLKFLVEEKVKATWRKLNLDPGASVRGFDLLPVEQPFA